jgi:hypothetical protein
MPAAREGCRPPAPLSTRPAQGGPCRGWTSERCSAGPWRGRRLLRLLASIAIVVAIGAALWFATRPPGLTVQGEVNASRADVSARVSGRVHELTADVGDTLWALVLLYGTAAIYLESSRRLRLPQRSKTSSDERRVPQPVSRSLLVSPLALDRLRQGAGCRAGTTSGVAVSCSSRGRLIISARPSKSKGVDSNGWRSACHGSGAPARGAGRGRRHPSLSHAGSLVSARHEDLFDDQRF